MQGAPGAGGWQAPRRRNRGPPARTRPAGWPTSSTASDSRPSSEIAGPRRQIGLRHCPFLDLIADQARVICPVHLGLMQGVMSALGASETVERLDPFAEPDLCLAHLGPVPAGRPSR